MIVNVKLRFLKNIELNNIINYQLTRIMFKNELLEEKTQHSPFL